MIVEISLPTFGRNVRYLRKKYHLSRRALAALTGISTRQLARIEGEETELQLSHDTLVRFREIFAIPLEDIIHADLCQQ